MLTSLEVRVGRSKLVWRMLSRILGELENILCVYNATDGFDNLYWKLRRLVYKINEQK